MSDFLFFHNQTQSITADTWVLYLVDRYSVRLRILTFKIEPLYEFSFIFKIAYNNQPRNQQ